MKIILVGFGLPRTPLCKSDLPCEVTLLDSSAAKSFDCSVLFGETDIHVFIFAGIGGADSGEIQRTFRRFAKVITVGVSLSVLKNRLVPLIGSQSATKVVERLTEDPNAGRRMKDDFLYLVPNHPVLAGAYASGNFKPAWKNTGGFPKRQRKKK